MVAAAEALEDRHPLSPQDADLARLGAWVEAQSRVALQRGHRHFGPERRLRDREVDGREDVVALANEPRVGTDAHEHEQVAGAAAERPRVTFARQADALAVVDARRDLDGQRPLLYDPPAPRAAPARILDHPPRAAASPAGLRAHELAERAPRHVLHVAAALAGRARDGARPGLGAAAVAAVAGDAHLHGHLARRARRRLDEVDRHLRRDVFATHSPAAARRSSEQVVAEERREDVREGAEVELRRREAAAAEPGVPVAVVELSGL